MNDRWLSSSWYRVARLTPKLRTQARIHRHLYRGEPAYILQNEASGRHYRFDAATYELLALFDGRRTVEEAWELACERLGDDAPTQDRCIRLLSQLHAADVLQCDVPPDALEVVGRGDRGRHRATLHRWANPFSVRVPLFDPDALLRRLLPAVRPLFSRYAFVLWLVVVLWAIGLATFHWAELTHNIADRVLSWEGLAILAAAFVALKIVHEFAHAFAVKVFGGEVHDMGIMFLVFAPIPYVDASASTAFRSRRRRFIVGAAGMMAELGIASVALAFWTYAEPGLARSLAFGIVLVAGVSTFFFNANPLIRFDGYYMLCDALEIPNLNSRGREYLVYLVERYAFGVRGLETNANTWSERFWYVGYSITSWIYRFFLYAAILVFVAGKFFYIGTALALWGVGTWLVVPAVRLCRYLQTQPRIAAVRRRAVIVSGAAVLFVIGATCWTRAPLRTTTEGVVWVPEEAIVRANASGFVAKIVAKPGTRVEKGDPIFVCEDPTIDFRIALLEAELSEYRARREGVWGVDQVAAKMYDEEIAFREKRLARERERRRDLTVRSRAAGIVVVPRAEDLPGRFARQGEVLAHVLDESTPTIRAVVSEDHIDLVRSAMGRVEVQLAGGIAEPMEAKVAREIPAASRELPSTVLGLEGGGTIATDPRDERGVQSFEQYFQIELALLGTKPGLNIGRRAFVRFDHGSEPLAVRWYRSVRRLFLRHLGT